ncbi:hypothetical protein E2C01_072740 [Portunus trituberculatus]|uniref:Uncharacterized protein n=1 Tax=Portunus trituberculatus TaxID=210409 RepID=A0A5B7I7Y9_PORTR|nr:hypothetical protein [Portunus trituberculatus]
MTLTSTEPIRAAAAVAVARWRREGSLQKGYNFISAPATVLNFLLPRGSVTQKRAICSGSNCPPSPPAGQSAVLWHSAKSTRRSDPSFHPCRLATPKHCTYNTAPREPHAAHRPVTSTA